MIGLSTYLPHTLVPLTLAVSLVRTRLVTRAPAVPADSNGLATFIATKVQVYEYFDDPNWSPRPLTRPCEAGVFRNGGAELRFADGRRSKRLLAVQAADIECVIDMLNHPNRALEIRSRCLMAASARIKKISAVARKESATLKAAARKARLQIELARGRAVERGNLGPVP